MDARKGTTRERADRRWAVPRTTLVLLTLCLAWQTVGCGRSDGPRRIEVFGTARHDGLPIARGSVSFLPAKGHSGPAATAQLDRGRYRLPQPAGPLPGPHRVVVESAPNLSKSLGPRGGRSQTRKWELEVVLPDASPFRQDFALTGETNGPVTDEPPDERPDALTPETEAQATGRKEGSERDR